MHRLFDVSLDSKKAMLARFYGRLCGHRHEGTKKQGCLIGALLVVFVFIIVAFIGGIVADVALPQFVKTSEQNKTLHALKMLAQIERAQEIFKNQHNYYAQTWAELGDDAPICQGVNHSLCKEAPLFAFELKEREVYAYRKKRTARYQLMFSYQPRELQCRAFDSNCRALTQ